jgi:hypothetical protein
MNNIDFCKMANAHLDSIRKLTVGEISKKTSYELRWLISNPDIRDQTKRIINAEITHRSRKYDKPEIPF